MLNDVKATSEVESSESSALVSKAHEPDGDRRNSKKPWCDFCKRAWHTRETCWKLHDKPPHVKNKQGGDGQAFQATSDLEQSGSSESSSFTKDQLEHLYKLFQSSSFNSSTPCSLAQKGNYLSAALVCHHSNPCFWIIDSGATDHMTSSPSLFSVYKPCAGNQKIKITDGSLLAIAGKGSIILSLTLTLHNVLHVPNLSCNLLSISKLTLDLNCCANFFQNHCEFQDLTSRKMIGSARQSGGLYFFEEVPSLRRQPPRTCFNSISAINNDNEVLLCHFRLGLPSFQYL